MIDPFIEICRYATFTHEVMIVVWFYKWCNQFSHCFNQDFGTTILLGRVFVRGQKRFRSAQHDRHDWMWKMIPLIRTSFLQEVFGTVPFRSLHLWKQLECYSTRASWRGVSWKMNTKKAYGRSIRSILPSTWHLVFFWTYFRGFLWLQALRCFYFFTKYRVVQHDLHFNNRGSEAWWNMMKHDYLYNLVYHCSCRIMPYLTVVTCDDPCHSRKVQRQHRHRFEDTSSYLDILDSWGGGKQDFLDPSCLFYDPS